MVMSRIPCPATSLTQPVLSPLFTHRRRRVVPRLSLTSALLTTSTVLPPSSLKEQVGLSMASPSRQIASHTTTHSPCSSRRSGPEQAATLPDSSAAAPPAHATAVAARALCGRATARRSDRALTRPNVGPPRSTGNSIGQQQLAAGAATTEQRLCTPTFQGIDNSDSGIGIARQDSGSRESRAYHGQVRAARKTPRWAEERSSMAKDSIAAHYDKWDSIAAEIEDDPPEQPAGPPQGETALHDFAPSVRAAASHRQCDARSSATVS